MIHNTKPKPIVLAALQYDGNLKELEMFADESAILKSYAGDPKIDTKNGFVQLRKTDWIVKWPDNWLEVFTNEDFQERFEKMN